MSWSPTPRGRIGRGLALVAILMVTVPVTVLLGRQGSGAEGRTTQSGAGPDGSSLTIPKAVVLGLVEGLTEYLPVSSTGHLLVVERILDVGQNEDERTAVDAFTVTIQLGAIAAVLGLYRRRLGLVAKGAIGRSPEGRRLLLALAAAFLPAAATGLLFGDIIEERLLRPWPVVAAWTVGGVAILVFVANQHRLRRRFDDATDMGVTVALLIGAFQALALWPGVSRSFVTLLGAMVLGASLTAAVEFAFLLGLVTLTAATGYSLLTDGTQLLEAFGWQSPLVATVVAGVAAFASVKWMVAYLNHRPLTVFGWYRLGIAAVTSLLLMTETI